MTVRAAVSASLVWATLLPCGLAAQAPAPDEPGPSDATLLLANAALGGLTTAVSRLVSHGHLDGFWTGAAGGALSFAGKRAAVMSFDGEGFVGRQVSAFGASVTRNAAEGRPPLDALLFAAGPVRLYVSREGEGWAWRPRLDLLATGVLATTLFRHDRAIDWAASVSAGALVVDLHERVASPTTAGSSMASTIFVHPGGVVDRAAVIAHERVHVLQKDFAFHLLGDRVEDRLMALDPTLEWLGRYVDLNLVYPVVERGLYELLRVPYERRPHEIEASALETRIR